MYLTKVAPISKIPRPSPQFLSYFTTTKLERGALVLVLLRKKKVKAIVFSQKRVIDLKGEIKKAQYQLKPISKVIEKNPVLQEEQIELAKWMADYYFSSFGKVLSLFLKKPKNKESNKKTKIAKNSFQIKFKIAPFDYIPKKQIEKALKENQQVLILVPEKEKIKFWKEKLKDLKSENLIIETRSGLFLPFENLGLIILTEEGNSGYKSEIEPRYNAKSVAEKLAKIWQAKLIIISSFPSVETYYLHKNTLLKQKKEKIKMPSCHIVDMQKVKPWQPLSEKLLFSIKEAIKNKGKVLLFLNRRGSATSLLCQDCGWIKKCNDCEVPLTYHLEKKSSPKLLCHYCGKEYEVPKICEICKSWNLNILGIGIEKIEKELLKNFKEENVLRLDSKEAKSEKEQKEVLKNFLEKKTAILLTTSIIFKYLPIEKLPLVGVVSIDSLLSQPDFKIEEECARIIEKLFSLAKEKFILQTFFPQSKAINWLKKEKKYFYEEALKERKKFTYPPFSSLIKISSANKNQTKIENEAFQIKKELEEKAAKLNIKNFEILGPSPAFIEKIKGKYQWKLIIKLKTDDIKLKTALLAKIPPTWKVNIDPERII